jgi:hypothetical protein
MKKFFMLLMCVALTSALAFSAFGKKDKTDLKNVKATPVPEYKYIDNPTVDLKSFA